MGLFRNCCCLLVLFFGPVAHAQKDRILPDSVIRSIKALPESMQDTAYMRWGQRFYALHTDKSISLAMSCYWEALSLSREYRHTSILNLAYFNIGSVYDAFNIPDKAIYYYKIFYHSVEKKGDKAELLLAANNLAVTYWKARDSAHSYSYIRTMQSLLPTLQGTPHYWQSKLLVANALKNINKQEEFADYFAAIPDTVQFVDGDLAFGRMYADCKSVYAQLRLNDKQQVIEPLQRELAVTSDSGEVLNILKHKLGELGFYKEYYETSELYDQVCERTRINTTHKDKEYQLLSLERLQQEKRSGELQQQKMQMQFKEQLLWILASFLVVGMLVSRYLLRRYKKRQNELKVKNVDISQQNENIKLLLNEIHHRVKNNLQIINSLIELQQTKQSDSGTAIREIQTKMQAIALAHEMMYTDTKQGTGLSLKQYIEKVTSATLEILRTGLEGNIQFTLEMTEDVELGLDKIVPLALIVNELMINSMKHALPSRGNLEILLKSYRQSGIVHFSYCDNGPGLPASVRPDQANTLGLRLIRKLAKQINFDLQVINKPGISLEYVLLFRK
jgi:two-component sensor histidine kinase